MAQHSSRSKWLWESLVFCSPSWAQELLRHDNVPLLLGYDLCRVAEDAALMKGSSLALSGYFPGATRTDLLQCLRLDKSTQQDSTTEEVILECGVRLNIATAISANGIIDSPTIIVSTPESKRHYTYYTCWPSHPIKVAATLPGRLGLRPEFWKGVTTCILTNGNDLFQFNSRQTSRRVQIDLRTSQILVPSGKTRLDLENPNAKVTYGVLCTKMAATLPPNETNQPDVHWNSGSVVDVHEPSCHIFRLPHELLVLIIRTALFCEKQGASLDTLWKISSTCRPWFNLVTSNIARLTEGLQLFEDGRRFDKDATKGTIAIRGNRLTSRQDIRSWDKPRLMFYHKIFRPYIQSCNGLDINDSPAQIFWDLITISDNNFKYLKATISLDECIYQHHKLCSTRLTTLKLETTFSRDNEYPPGPVLDLDQLPSLSNLTLTNYYGMNCGLQGSSSSVKELSLRGWYCPLEDLQRFTTVQKILMTDIKQRGGIYHQESLEEVTILGCSKAVTKAWVSCSAARQAHRFDNGDAVIIF